MTTNKISLKGLKFHAPLTDEFLQTATLASDVSAYHNHSNSVSGAPTFGSDGVNLAGTSYLEFPCTGVFNESNVTIAIRFIPNFAANSGTGHVILDSTSLLRYGATKRNDNTLRIIIGNQILSDIPLANYSSYWNVSQENTLIISAISGDNKVWLNGNQILSNAATWSAADPSVIYVGASFVGSSIFNGKIRDVMVFNRIITDAERLAFESSSSGLYPPIIKDSLQRNLVLDMPLTSKWAQSSIIASDRSAYRYHTTHIVGSPTFSSEGLSLPASPNSYLRAAYSNWRSGDTSGTFSIWFKTSESTSSNRWFFTVGKDTTNYFIVGLRGGGGDNLRIIQTTAGDTASGVYGNTGGLKDGQWHMCTITSNGSRYLIYLDGQLDGKTAFTLDDGDWFASLSGATDIYIGNLVLFSGAWFVGELASLKVWNRELSADKISQLFKMDNH